MAPRVNRKSIEKYFELSNNKAVCRLCAHVLKIDRIFNLKTHAIKVHKIKPEEFASVNNSESESVDQKIKKTIIKVDISKKQVLRSYIGLLTEDDVPFQALNSDHFKSILNPICRALSIKHGKTFSLISTNCKKYLKIIADNVRNAIKSDIQQRLLSLKIDVKTDTFPNLYCISVQFIQSNEIQSHILGVLELRSESLETEMLKMLTKYDIDLSQIVSITTGTNLDNKDHSNEANWDNLVDSSLLLQLGDVKITCCLALTAQLCAWDITQDKEICNFLLNCRNLVTLLKINSNYGYREIFEENNISMPQHDDPKNWGSTYEMIASLKNSKDIILKYIPIKCEFMVKAFNVHSVLEDSFWDFVEAYCLVFERLQQTIVKFQQEQLHYGNFYAEWLKCKLITEKFLQKDHKTCVKDLAQRLLLIMEARTTQLLKNDSFISCLYLDPRFQHTLNKTQKHASATYLKKLYEKIKFVNALDQTRQENSFDSSSSSLDGSEFSLKADEYLNEYLTRSFASTKNENTDVYKKIENLQLPFLRADSNILHFWSERQFSDPELYALSNICFAIPATQVITERAFSSVKLLSVDRNNLINQDTQENILLIKLNSTFLDQAIDAMPMFRNVD